MGYVVFTARNTFTHVAQDMALVAPVSILSSISHVAAVFYGVGAVLHERPFLCGADENELVARALSH